MLPRAMPRHMMLAAAMPCLMIRRHAAIIFRHLFFSCRHCHIYAAMLMPRRHFHAIRYAAFDAMPT